MKSKIQGNKVNLKDWQDITKHEITSFTSLGVKVTYEIHIYFPKLDGVIQRRVFKYEKENEMIKDYQKLIIKVLLK